MQAIYDLLVGDQIGSVRSIRSRVQNSDPAGVHLVGERGGVWPGARASRRRVSGRRTARVRGRAVQLDPIKPTLKVPGTKRLKLQYDEFLSSLPFKFNLRRYTGGKRSVASEQPIPTQWSLDMVTKEWTQLLAGPKTCRHLAASSNPPRLNPLSALVKQGLMALI